jgi:hypothetical protein
MCGEGGQTARTQFEVLEGGPVASKTVGIGEPANPDREGTVRYDKEGIEGHGFFSSSDLRDLRLIPAGERGVGMRRSHRYYMQARTAARQWQNRMVRSAFQRDELSCAGPYVL